MIEKWSGKEIMWKGSVRRCNFFNFFLIRILNPFESLTRRTCSRSEPNYDLQDRLDLTVRPEGSLDPPPVRERTVVETPGHDIQGRK